MYVKVRGWVVHTTGVKKPLDCEFGLKAATRFQAFEDGENLKIKETLTRL